MDASKIVVGRGTLLEMNKEIEVLKTRQAVLLEATKGFKAMKERLAALEKCNLPKKEIKAYGTVTEVETKNDS